MLKRLFTECYFTSALVLELVDRHDSGSCVRKGVEVQVLSRALSEVALSEVALSEVALR